MDFRANALVGSELTTASADALLLIVPSEPSQWQLPKPLSQAVNDAVKQGDIELKANQTLVLHGADAIKAKRLVVAVANAAADADAAKAFKAAVAAAIKAAKGTGAAHALVAWGGRTELGAAHAEAVVTVTADAMYVYRHTKPSAPKPPALKSVTIGCAKSSLADVKQGIARGQAVAAGVELARECANRPGNHCTPSFLASEAKRLAREHKLGVTVLDRPAIEKLGMGSFLAVAQASHEPMKFIVLRYDGASKNEPPVVLVGKGITFDTGGISLKPAAEMDEMKFDMGGAASVLGTMRAVAELKPKVNLVGIIPACENMPGGRAVKPGDVVTSMSGQTIEILNTDAEGRLILCDALTYAERFKPKAVVDIATLTGACVIALGHHHSGLFSSDDELAQSLLAASRDAQDPAWRMPLDDEYDEALKSNFADMGNVGGRPGGAITAARFLRKFTGKFRWAHLDIAGTAWKSGHAKGATGRPVPLLTHFVLSQAGSQAGSQARQRRG
jgi:leucyl aminopeptidase